MYKQRDDVERLIEALTSGEKRYFSTNYKTHYSEKDLPLYLALYELHENGKSQLPKNLEGIEGRALTSAKRRLYDNLVDSVVSLNKEHSVNNQVQYLLSAIELLLFKGLSSQALLLWKKAYDACIRQEKFGLLLQVLDWEKRLNIVLDSPTRHSDKIKDEEDSTLEKMKQILALERIYSHIMLLKRQYGYVKGVLKEKLEQETILSAEMPREKDCLSEKALYYFNLVHAIYYWMVKDHPKGYESSKKLIVGSGANILPSDYIYGIFQHITSSVCLGKFGDTLNGITLAEDYLRENHLDQSVAFSVQLFAYKATYSLVVYNYMGDRRKLVSAIIETEEQLRQFSNVLPLEYRQIVTGNLMNAYAAIGNFKKADMLWLDLTIQRFSPGCTCRFAPLPAIQPAAQQILFTYSFRCAFCTAVL